MRVLRVEHKRKRDRFVKSAYVGPYASRGWDGIDEMLDEHMNPFTHPCIDDDIRKYLSMSNDWFCGFKNESDLEKWFGDWRGPLHDAGFVVREYETQIVVHGESGRQLVFKITDSEKIKTYNLV